MGGILLSAVSLGLLWAVMTIGVFITYRVLDIADLTVEGSITLGAAVAARLITGGVNPWVATAAALASGLLAGLVTGLLHTKLKIPALLSGILTMIALYSVNLRVMGKSNTPLLRNDSIYTPLQNLGVPATWSVLIVGVVCVALVIAVLYWFFGTELGSAVRATGNNEHMVRAQGINTSTMKILGLVLSNGLVAFSGALIAQQQSFADVQMGIGSIVIGLASVIIGEVLFGTRSFLNSLISLALGAVTYRIIIALVLKMGMSSDDLKLFTAITVALALSLPVIKDWIQKGRRDRQNRKEEQANADD